MLACRALGLLPAGTTVDPAAIEPAPDKSWILDLDMFSASPIPFTVDRVVEDGAALRGTHLYVLPMGRDGRFPAAVWRQAMTMTSLETRSSFDSTSAARRNADASGA